MYNPAQVYNRVTDASYKSACPPAMTVLASRVYSGDLPASSESSVALLLATKATFLTITLRGCFDAHCTAYGHDSSVARHSSLKSVLLWNSSAIGDVLQARSRSPSFGTQQGRLVMSWQASRESMLLPVWSCDTVSTHLLADLGLAS